MRSGLKASIVSDVTINMKCCFTA